MCIFIDLNIYLSVYLYVCLPVYLSVISFVLPEWWINVYILKPKWHLQLPICTRQTIKNRTNFSSHKTKEHLDKSKIINNNDRFNFSQYAGKSSRQEQHQLQQLLTTLCECVNGSTAVQDWFRWWWCYSSQWKPISELRSVTCRITCHSTQVNAPRLNPSQIGRYSIYLLQRDGRLSWPRRLVTYRDCFSARRQSPIAVLTRPGVQ